MTNMEWIGSCLPSVILLSVLVLWAHVGHVLRKRDYSKQATERLLASFHAPWDS